MHFSQKSVKNKFFAIIVFYVIAISLRYLANKTTILENIDSSFLKIVLQGIGPSVGAFVSWKIFGLRSSYSLSGKLKPLLVSFFVFIVIPVIGFAIIGINESKNITITSTAFIASAKLSFYFFLYAILEEIGWRAFLQEQLHFVNKYVRILIVAFLWFVWHLNFALTLSNFIFLIVLIFASWGIGKIGDITKSILAVASFHALYNLFSIDSFPSKGKYIVLFISLIIWILYIVFYDRVKNNIINIKNKAV